jgi:hypothetical protein
MIYRSVCEKCKKEFYYSCFEESKFVTPVCCGKPTIYKENENNNRKLNEK